MMRACLCLAAVVTLAACEPATRPAAAPSTAPADTPATSGLRISGFARVGVSTSL